MDRCCVCAPSRKERPGAAKRRMRGPLLLLHTKQQGTAWSCQWVYACGLQPRSSSNKEQTSKLRRRRMCGPLLRLRTEPEGTAWSGQEEGARGLQLRSSSNQGADIKAAPKEDAWTPGTLAACASACTST